MKLGYTLIYVTDVAQTVSFYEKAFGLQVNFLHESGHYGELKTGETALAFIKEELMNGYNFNFKPNRLADNPAGFEIAFVTDTVQEAYDHAVNNGALPLQAPEEKPWGQVVAYVKDINGVLVEICSPMQF